MPLTLTTPDKFRLPLVAVWRICSHWTFPAKRLAPSVMVSGPLPVTVATPLLMAPIVKLPPRLPSSPIAELLPVRPLDDRLMMKSLPLKIPWEESTKLNVPSPAKASVAPGELPKSKLIARSGALPSSPTKRSAVILIRFVEEM